MQSTLRIEIARATLKGEDRRLFDEYLAANREIALQLFDDAPQIRLAALQRVALKPDSGAGVLLALKVNDADAYVAEAALDSAMRLKDTVVARCLTHYVQSIAEALGTGFFGANDQDAAAVSAQYVRRAIEVIGAAKYTPAAPAIASALLALGRSPYSGSGFFELPPVAEALANLGDRKAAAALMHFLDKPGLSRVAPLGPGKSLSLTIGDEILLMFCKLYDQKPAEFGLSANETGAFGYLDEDTRAEGHRKFRLWYREHGEPLPTSQPATWTPGDAPKIAPAPTSQPAEPAKKDAP